MLNNNEIYWFQFLLFFTFVNYIYNKKQIFFLSRKKTYQPISTHILVLSIIKMRIILMIND